MHDFLTTAVGNLTNPRHPCGTVLLVVLVLAAVPVPAETPASAWQPVEAIRSAAERYVDSTLGSDDPRIAPSAGHLDSRLQLPACSTDLDPYLQSGNGGSGRVIVGVRCNGDKPWNVYLPVHVAVMEDVLVTADALPRDHVLTERDFTVMRRDVSRLAGGYLTNVEATVGQRLKRPLARGIVLTPAQLEPQILVRKGQTVTLVVAGDTVNIRTSGKALMDGAHNERIRVENTVSGRIVEGLVRSNQQVEVP